MPKEPEEEQWDVEVFLAARKVSKRSWLYLVKWADWPDRFNLWLSTANVMPSCKRLRESFWSHGVDVPDPKKCPVGTEIAANPEWIELEKARYAEVYGKTSKLDPDRLKKDIERWEQSNGVPSANPVVEPRDTDSDDIPLSQLKRKRDDSTPALKIRIPAAAVRRFQSVTESQISSQPDGEPPRKVARTDKQQPSAGSPSSLFSKSPTPDVAGESQSPTSEPANDFVPPADSRPITRPPVIERLRKEPPDIFLRPKKGKPQAPVETHDAAIVPRLPPNALATKLRIAERIFEPDRLQASHDSSSAVPPPPPPVEAIFPTSPTSHDFQDNIPLYEEPAFSFNDWLQDTGTPSDGELDRDEVVEMCLREEHHEPMPEADGEDSQVPQSPVLDNFDSVSIDLGDFFDREHTLVSPTDVPERQASTPAESVQLDPPVLELNTLMSPIEDSQATLHSRKTTPINLEVQPGPKTSRTDEPDGHENPTSTSLAEASPSDRPRQIRLDYARMTQDLKIPDYLSQELSGKKYFIWGEVDGASSRTCERETSYLTMSLRKHHAQDIRGKNWEMRPAAFVFVHASAMTTISSLPSLTYRRRDMAATFLCYGSDENMHPTPRGIREIFPARTGIVTFTANALLDDPAGICNLIANRDDRWECYILPTVVGLVAKTYGDATDALEREEFMHAWLLEAIEKGQLELLTSSPFSPASDAYVRCGRNLRRWGLDVVGCDAQELLKICVDAFASKHAHTREADWDRANEEEIKDFVLSLQAQPEVFSRYRRFVVIKGHDDKHIRWDANGLEWLALPQFHW